MLIPHTSDRLEAGVQYHFSAIVGHDTDGHWARRPELQGCYAQGDTYEAALNNLREVETLHADDRLSCGEDIPHIEAINPITVDVPG